jgi:serine/threonine protein kinase
LVHLHRGNETKANDEIGIVGSDPYLAPEVYDSDKKYNPAAVDVWSLAIIFCCMTLRRFPWKSPRLSDNSYKLFVTQPTEEELRSSIYPQKPQSEPASRMPFESAATNATDPQHRHSHGDHGHRYAASESIEPSSASFTSGNTIASAPSQPAQVIKGPWRILRLLPRESRHIISRMLELDPAKRASLEDIISDSWVKRTQFCRQEPGGAVFKAENHVHHLEAASSATTPTPSNKVK